MACTFASSPDEKTKFMFVHRMGSGDNNVTVIGVELYGMKALYHIRLLLFHILNGLSYSNL